MSEKEKVRKELRELGDLFLRSIKEEVDSCVLLCDADRLYELIHHISVYLAYRLVHNLLEKGLEEEFGKLCVKASQLKSEESSERPKQFEVMMRYTFGTMEFPKEVHLGVYSGVTKEEAIAKAREDPFVKGIERDFKETGADWRGEKYLKFYAYEI